MTLSTYARSVLVDHVVGGPPAPQPSELWVQLHVGDPGPDGLDNLAVETGRRQGAFTASSGVATANGPLGWGGLPADEVYTHASLHDAETVGNCWAYDPLDDAVQVRAGDAVQLNSVRFLLL